jgi:hypothetical protein
MRLPSYGQLVLAICFVAAMTMHAGAQGFMVKPMTIEANPAPNQTIELPLEVRNTALDGPRTIQLRLVDLSQDTQGTWQMVEDGSDIDLSGHASSLDWTTLSTDTVEIGPEQPAEIIVSLQPPANARGYYFAGIVAETPIPETPAEGVLVRVRFLIPLIIEIRGRPVRQDVALDDVGMTYRTDTGSTPTTTAAMTISNRGHTYSRVRGELSVERQNGSTWRVVTRMPVKERGIIPGVTLELGGGLERRLPSGTYRLRATVYVDGRRIKPVEREIAFVGDPDVDSLAYDTALTLAPETVEMKVAPGATRTTIVRIENPGEHPVDVKMDARMPQALLGVARGELQGDAFSAARWTEIRPAEFTIRPGRWQNVRVMSHVPREGVDHPNYYADLVLRGTYKDGQSAGETRSTVHLANAGIEPTVKGLMDDLSIAEAGEPGWFALQMRLSNVGDIDVDPTTRALLVNEQGGLVRAQSLSGEEGALLPFGRRTYSAEMDFTGIEPGFYTLSFVADLGDDQEATEQRPLEIAMKDGSETPSVFFAEPTTNGIEREESAQQQSSNSEVRTAEGPECGRECTDTRQND